MGMECAGSASLHLFHLFYVATAGGDASLYSDVFLADRGDRQGVKKGHGATAALFIQQAGARTNGAYATARAHAALTEIDVHDW